jgi:polar amino acid transport system substrate-binding protein
LSFLIGISSYVSAKPINICITEYPPYEYTDPVTGKIVGKTAEIVYKVFKDIQTPIVIESMPFERCLNLLKEGEKDATFDLSKNQDREKYLVYMDEPTKVQTYSIVVEKSKKTALDPLWSQKKDLKILPAPIASPQGYSCTLKAKEQGVPIDDSAGEDETNLKKLVGGRAASIIIEESVFKSIQKNIQGAENFTLLDKPFVDPKNYYIAFSKAFLEKNPLIKKIMPQLNQAILKNK